MIIALATLAIVQNYMMAFVATCIVHAAIIGLIQTQRHNSSIPIHVYTCLLLFFFTFWLLKEANIIAANPKLSRLYNPVRLGTLVAVFFAGVNVSGNGWLGWISYFNYIPAITAIVCNTFTDPENIAGIGTATTSNHCTGFCSSHPGAGLLPSGRLALPSHCW